MPVIRMPHEWDPMPHQLPALAALDRGIKRAVLMWHRRAGKDAMTVNWCAKTMAQRPTSVLYLFPELKQARKALWDEIDPNSGKTHIDQALPKPLRDGEGNRQDGVLKLFNGSLLQLGGFDSIDSYMGIGPRVVVFSEYATSQYGPRAWQLVQPMLLRNDGVAIFPYTPRGKNHGKELYDSSQSSPDWFSERLTIDDTKLRLPSGGTLVEAVKRAVDNGEMAEDYARQEFWCSFEAPNSGSYYGRLIEAAENDGRITEVDWNPDLPVCTWWDIGVSDATAIWFVQPERSGRIRVIDYYEAEGEGLHHYLEQLERRRARGWMFDASGQLVPHDFASREFGGGKSPLGVAREMGWRMTVVPAGEVQHGIDNVRRVLPRCWFDKGRCAAGLNHLREYRKRWSDQLQTFLGPLHDQHSHCADAFRIGVNGMREAGFAMAPNPSQAALTERRAGWRQGAMQVQTVTYSDLDAP